jgi:hypothetical protein
MRIGGRIRGRTAAAAVMLVASLGAGGASWAASASAAGPTVPPCSRQALASGLRRGHVHGTLERGFRCAGRFAYSGVLVGSGAHRITITVLFRAGSDGWTVASRGKYCQNGSVPSRIRRGACDSN